ncbi:sulfite exporter TauE/SafE family protein [Aerophototrophica crusticola]|uniref:Sulfite exporter TauE/SafE family protein n=1 Tax=Aerophototrophica crusticola TaxID=1709002 RepID=A0A858R693_9PROT|nr:sulfite exporter TauE/SafE family protein [Rhodospirillaceae bacterium B3]
MHDHAHHAAQAVPHLLEAASLWPLMAALFMTGLVGGFGHCTGMCGPFVMAQVAGGIANRPASADTVLRRAAGGVLVPYHLGRLTTYGLLGAVAGGLSGMVVQATGFRWVLVGFLALAATLFLLQGLGGLARWMPALAVFKNVSGLGWASQVGQALSRPLRPLFAKPGGLNGYLLGVTLGFLPCGFLYAALASAVGAGSMVGGLALMAAFALGTMPSLMTVGILGSVAGSRWVGVMKALTPALMLFNAGVVATMAWHAAG